MAVPMPLEQPVTSGTFGDDRSAAMLSASRRGDDQDFLLRMKFSSVVAVPAYGGTSLFSHRIGPW